jgi:hypothetical protein
MPDRDYMSSETTCQLLGIALLSISNLIFKILNATIEKIEIGMPLRSNMLGAWPFYKVLEILNSSATYN